MIEKPTEEKPGQTEEETRRDGNEVVLSENDASSQPCPPSADDSSLTTKEKKSRVAAMFSAKRLALMAIFAALAFAVSLLSFPLFPGTPASFLELDFGNVLIMLIGFLLGPVEGVIVCVVKELLRLMASGSGGVGELANVLMTCSYILVPSVVYKFHKGLKAVIPSMFVGCLLASGMSLVANRFILIPFYGIADPASYFANIWGLIVAFNAVKTVAISLLTLLLYKRLSVVLKKFGARGKG